MLYKNCERKDRNIDELVKKVKPMVPVGNALGVLSKNLHIQGIVVDQE
jgi:hypothetical protein